MLEYQDEISSIDTCPRDDFEKKEQIAFRFVLQNPPEKNSFLPVIKMNPRRGHNFNSKQLCDAYSLSMFKTEEEAIVFYEKLKARFPNIKKSIGNSLASGKLKEKDGLSGNYRKDGHFSFFPFKNISLNRKFIVINSQL